MLTFVIAALVAVLPRNGEAVRCRISTLVSSPGYVWPIPYIKQFVDSSEVIVRARAAGAGPQGDKTILVSNTGNTVRFEPVEWIKKDTALSELVILGELTDSDDFNSRPVPYQIVRPGGQRGNCVATDYRVGREYLFLLKRREGKLTPYWEGLAPLNEQVRGPTDPWLEWVRRSVSERSGKN